MMSKLVTAIQTSNKETTRDICIMISGGNVEAPVIIDYVRIELGVQQAVGGNTKLQELKFPPIVIPSRRRAPIPTASPRRRSIINILEEGKEIRGKVELKYKPMIDEKYNIRDKFETIKKKLQVEWDLRTESKRKIQEETDARFAKEFSEQAYLAEQMAIAKQLTDMQVAPVISAKYNEFVKENTRNKTAALQRSVMKTEMDKMMSTATIQSVSDGRKSAEFILKTRVNNLVSANLQSEVNKALAPQFKKDVETALNKKIAEYENSAYNILFSKALDTKLTAMALKQAADKGAEEAVTAAKQKRYETALNQDEDYVNAKKELAKSSSISSQNRIQPVIERLELKYKPLRTAALNPQEQTNAVERGKQAGEVLLRKDSEAQVKALFDASDVRAKVRLDLTTKWKPIVTAEVNSALALSPVVTTTKQALTQKFTKEVNANNALNLLIASETTRAKGSLIAALTPKTNALIDELVNKTSASSTFKSELTSSNANYEKEIRANLTAEIGAIFNQKARENVAKQKSKVLSEVKAKVEQVADEKLANDISMINMTIIEAEVVSAMKTNATVELKKTSDEKTLEIINHLQLPQKLKQAVIDGFSGIIAEEETRQVAKSEAKSIRDTIQAQTDTEIANEVKKIFPSKIPVAGADNVTINLIENSLTDQLTLQLQPLVNPKVQKAVSDLIVKNTDSRLEKTEKMFATELEKGVVPPSGDIKPVT